MTYLEGIGDRPARSATLRAGGFLTREASAPLWLTEACAGPMTNSVRFYHRPPLSVHASGVAHLMAPGRGSTRNGSPLAPQGRDGPPEAVG